MSYLYLTADRVGIQTGGGLVTNHECMALTQLAGEKLTEIHVLSRYEFEANANANGWKQDDPWHWDRWAHATLDGHTMPKLAHVYAGTFSDTVGMVQFRGDCKVVYTAAAHDVKVSREEHERLGFAYDYPHITQPELWTRYVKGYLDADVLICPSKHSADVMRGFGATNRIEIIPHGCDLPETVKPLPKQKTIGYVGAVGPDKGLTYLLQAWKLLNRKDATLVLAGRDSTSPVVGQWIEQIGCGNVRRLGWQDSISDFYDSLTCYVQPSASEGFGIEVLEAQSHARPVICSDGAGAADVVLDGWVVPARNAEALAAKIDRALNMPNLAEVGMLARKRAADFTWPSIRKRYQEVWRSLL